MIKNMEIDISSATALDKDGFPRYKSDDNVDIKTFMPRGSLVSKRLYQGDELTRSLSESKEFKVDVLGQIGSGIASSFLNFTAKTVANIGDLVVQIHQRKTQRQADYIKRKRENPKYNPRLDIARLSDDFALAYAEREKPIEIDTKEGKQTFKQNNVFENINNGVNKYISENFAMKQGLANEMIYRMASGGASIAFSYGVGGILRAMKAATVIQAGAPAAWIGLVSGGSAAEEAKAKGFDLDKQLKVFKEVGVSETAIEFMGMNAILSGMRGARPISRIALDTFNNMSQEFLQGFSEGAILKNEGIRQETWGSILTDATKDFFSAMIPSGAASSAHYYYQNKSLIGDFRQAGLSDNDADVVLDEVMKLKDDSTVDDFLNGLEQKGLPKDLAKKATKVVEDYNGRIAIRNMLKDSPLTQIIMKLRSKGVKSANALLAAEKILGEEVPKAVQREMINLIDKQMADYNKLEAEEQVKYAFMKKYVELGKYGKFLKATDEEWLQSGIALADVAAAQAIKQAEFEGWQKGLDVKEQNDLNALEFKRKSEEVLTPEELKKRQELLKKKAKEGARTPIQVFEGLNIELRKKDKGKGDLFQEGDVKNDAEDFIKKNPNATAEEFVASKGKELFRGDANPITIELYDVSQGIKEGKELGGAMAEGPGVYLTTDKNNALSYGKNITNVVMDKDSNILEKGQKKLSISKINKLLTSIDKETLDIALSNFDENPIIAKRNLIDAINNADDAQEQIINIWADVFYHQKPEKFMKVMADNGIDGLKIDKEKLSHYVIYNKKSLIDKSQLLSEFEKAKKQKELFQGDVKNLVSMHNLSSDKLLHADKMGGLAVPSLSIGRVGHPLEGFGDITLISDKSLIDPKRKSTKVFNADIYSPRYPSVKHDFDPQGLKEARESVAKEEKDLDKSLGSELDSYDFNRDGIKALYRSTVLQLKYLRETGRDIDVPKKSPKLEYISLMPEIEKFVEDWTLPENLYKDKEFLSLYEQLRNKVMDKARKDDLASGATEAEALKTAELYGESWYDEDGNPNFYVITQLREESAQKKESGKPDYYAAERAISDIIRDEQTQFQEWVDKNYSSVLGKERLYNGEDGNYNAKYLPHTLENVVRVMKRELQSGEGFNYGLGNVRASVAKRYKSISEIQSDRDKVLSKEEFEKVKEFTDKEFDDIISEAYEKYEHKGVSGIGDIFTNVLIDGIRRGNIEAELKEYGFGTMDMGRIKVFLSTIKDMPTEYFEAKIQRAVELSEFTAAVIPFNTPDRAIRVLERNNISYAKYDPNIEGDRSRVIRAISSKKNVLFQSKDFPRASIDFSSEEGKRIITMFENADASSMLHELGHVWFKDMFDYVKSGKADANYLEHYQAVKEYLGLDDNQSELTVEQQETFARSLEAFFMEGNAPIGKAKLQGAFSAFREWLKRVYIDKQSLNVELSDDIRDFFARMFGGYRAMTQEDVLTIEPISINELAVIADEEDIGRMKVDIETLKEKIKFYKKIRDYFRGIDKKGLLNIDEYELYYKGEFQDLSVLEEYFRKEGGTGLDDVAQSFFDLYPEMKRYSEDVSETDEIIQIMKQVLTHDFTFSYERSQIAFLEEIIKASEGKEVVGDFRDISIEEAEKIFGGKAENIYLKNLVEGEEKSVKSLLSPKEQKYSITLRQWMKDRQTASKRGYKSGVKETKAKFNAILKELKTTGKINRKNIIDLIKGLDLEAKDKAKFLSSVGRVDTAEKMADEVRDIERRYSAYYESAQKNAIEEEIANELSTTKPVKEGRLTKGRYDYERNKLFETLRAYSKMTKDEAREALSLIDFTEDRIVPEEELITRRLLSLKANGKESSLELFEQVLSDIGRIKIHGRLAKNEADFIKRVERREFLEKIMPVLESKKNDAEAVKTQILGFYLRGFSNTYSMLNALFNKETALALDPEPLEIDAKTAMYFVNRKIVNDSLRIFGLEKDNDLHKLFEKMSLEKFETVDFEGIVNKIDRMQVIDIYNSIKNEKIRERYSRYLGMEQVQSLVDNLTSKEKEFADYLQTTIQSYYDVLNNKSIALTGRDLGRIENYWPATSEKPVDIYEDFVQQSNIPSALMNRGGVNVIPKPVNAWHKAQRHVVQALHTQYLSNRFEELRRIFLDRKITKIIQLKFGEDVHAVMMNKINDLALNKQLDRLDEITKVFQKALNNWVVAKVSLNPSIFFKQLVSTGNYMEDMPVKEWIKYFAQGISSPKETFDFMWNNAPFLEARFNTGYEEALSRAMSGSKEILKLSHDWAQGLTSLVRSGDITAIIMGGYPLVKYEMEVNGKSLDEAMEIFKNQTYKAQQSPMLSGLSEWQKNKNPFARLFLVFRNTSNQYLRKQVDAIISYNNGDIDKVQLGKVLAIYGVIQPTLWVSMGYAINNSISLLSKIMSGGGDDNKEKNMIEDVFNEIVLSPFKSLAIVESLVNLAIRRAQGKPQWKIYSLPLLDDVSDSISKVFKKNLSLWDYLDIAGGIIEPTKGLPIKTWSRYGKKIIGDGNNTKKRKVRRLIKKKTKMKSKKRMVKKR